MYNVYKTSPKIRIRWLSEETSKQNIFGLDFYDSTDMDCVLTSVSLNKLSKGKFELTKAERDRIENILKRALDVEKGIVIKPEISAENPDGCKLAMIYCPVDHPVEMDFNNFMSLQWIFLFTKMNLKSKRNRRKNVNRMIRRKVEVSMHHLQQSEKA